jgi:hypothetical protein
MDFELLKMSGATCGLLSAWSASNGAVLAGGVPDGTNQFKAPAR